MTLWRSIVLLLALANLLFYAWSRGYLGQRELTEPQRLAQQIAPEKLRLIGGASVASDRDGGERGCQRITGLNRDTADFLRRWIKDLPEIRLVEQEGSGRSWWVYIPASPSRAAADKRLAELRAQGQADPFVVTDPGPHRNAISLGLFKSEAAAADLVKRLSARGVTDGRVEVRPAPEGPIIELTGPPAKLRPLMTELEARASAGKPLAPAPLTIKSCQETT